VPQGMANEATKDVWVYDVASGGAGGVNGSLTSNTRYRGTTLGSATSVWSESYMYDVNSKRLTQRIVNQEGESTQLATKYQFDSYYGREKAVTYPSGFTVWRQYDPYGHLATLVDLATLTPMWSETSSDAFGHATSEQFGTRVVGAYTYSASTGQATALNWTTPQGGALDGLIYTYDSLGNLTQQSRPSVPGSESYSYDLLQRLVSTTRSTAGTVTYQYDPVGNIMAKSDYSRSAYGSYHYSATQPNAVTSVTLANGQTATYSYDANGNEIGPTSGYTIQEMYDANNQARTITRGGTANFFYAPNGSRYRETSSATNIFGSDGYERTVDGNGTTHRHELGPVVYTLNGGTGKTTYMLRDRLGSVISELDTNGNVVYDATGQNSKAQRTYDAFGKVRNTDYSDRPGGVLSLADTTLRGFTGQEHVDNVQVIHMNGRIYDYQLGRFLGVDPIIGNPIKSQSLNPYSYIGNNPLSGVDPTGFKAFCMGDKTCQALDDMDFLGGAAGKLRNSLTYGGAGGGGFQLLALDTEGKSRMAAVLPQITMSGIDTVDIAMSTVSAMAPSSVGPTTLITPIEEVGPTILEHPIVRWAVGVAGPYLLELAEPVAIAVGVGFLTLTPSNVGQCNSGCGCGSLVCGPAPSPVLPIADQGPSQGDVRLPTVMNSGKAESGSVDVKPDEIAGRTPGQIDQIARQKGLIPKGDPQTGRGAYVDPVTGEQRVLVHPNADCGPHCHVNDASGNRLDINGNKVAPESPEAHLPLGGQP